MISLVYLEASAATGGTTTVSASMSSNVTHRTEGINDHTRQVTPTITNQTLLLSLILYLLSKNTQQQEK